MVKEFLQSVKEIQKNAIKYNFPDAVWDATVAELQEKLMTIYSFLSKQSNLVIVDQYTQNKRNGVLNNLTQILTHLPGVANWENNLANIFTWTETIYDFIYADLIVSKEVSNYSIETAELKQARKDYIATTKDLQKLLENKNIASEFAQLIPEIQTKLDTTEASYQRIRELEQTIEQKKDIIGWFAWEVENYKKSIEETQNWYKRLSDDNQENTTKLVEKNTELQQKVTDYLSNVIWWKSSERLVERANQIHYQKRIRRITWTTIIAIFLLCIVFGAFKPFIEWISNLEWISWRELILLRFSIFIPFLLLDIFFYSQFSFEKKLKEEYNFRAIISWTLETYIDLLQDNEKREDNKEFIINTANKIFESPISQNDGIKVSDLKDISKQVIQKTIDKFW